MDSDKHSSKLDLTSLKEAITCLGDAIETYTAFSQNPAICERDINTIKSGVIQNFEVAYEQCWKFMKRWLEENISPDSVDGITRKELFRLGAEHHLIADVEEWIRFHQSRNLTSHTYNGINAQTAFATALSFLPAARDFYIRLEARND